VVVGPVIYNQTVVRVRVSSTTKDAQGNPVYDWGDGADRVTYDRVAVQPLTSSETENSAEQRDQVFTNYRVSTRRGIPMDVTVYDRIEWAGSTWSVSESPQFWPHPHAAPPAVHHVSVTMTRVEA
jgi:hypothetical protein